MGKKFSGMLVALMAVAMMATTSQKAEAVQLWGCLDQVCSSGITILADDATDGTPNNGFTSFDGSFDGFDIVFNSALSHPALTGTQPDMDFSFQLFSFDAADAWFYAVDFFTGPESFTAHLGGTTDFLNGITGVVVDNFGGLISPILTLGPFGPGAYSASGSGTGPGGTYALALGIHAVHTELGNSSGDFRITPEPATTALFGLALFGVGIVLRRRFALQS